MLGELKPWTYWDQLNDSNTDADGTDENRVNNCGPEAVAMVVKYVTGVELYADSIKDQMRGDRYVGYTSPSELRDYLARYCSIPASIVVANAYNMQRTINNECIDQGLPSILLIDWLQPDVGGHFVCPVAYDEDALYVADPWGGFQRRIAWTEFPSWTQGLLVRCSRQRDPNLPTE